MSDLRIEPVAYRLTTPVRTARGEVRDRSGFLVHADGGVGEVLPLPGWSTISVAEAEQALRGVAEGAPLVELPAQVLAGIDGAAWTARSARTGEPLWSLLGGRSGSVRVNALVAGGSRAELSAGVDAAVVAGFATVKVKMGFADDHGRLELLSELVPPTVRVRLDPNGAWGADAPRLCAEAARALGERLEYVEDPVATADAFVAVRNHVDVPVGLDELAVGRPPGVVADLARPGDIVVVKPALAGGIAAVRDLVAAGLDVVVSSLYDGPVGLATWLALAAALPGGRAHGLGTAALVDHPDMARLVPVAGLVRLE